MSRKDKAPATPEPSRDELLARVDQLTHRVDALLTIVAPILTKRVSNAKQASIAGVSRTTLWRRRRAAAAQFALRPRNKSAA